MRKAQMVTKAKLNPTETRQRMTRVELDALLVELNKLKILLELRKSLRIQRAELAASFVNDVLADAQSMSLLDVFPILRVGRLVLGLPSAAISRALQALGLLAKSRAL